MLRTGEFSVRFSVRLCRGVGSLIGSLIGRLFVARGFGFGEVTVSEVKFFAVEFMCAI